MEKPWFKAKYFGWGWQPATWQGWLITLAYVGIVAIPVRGLKHSDPAGPTLLHLAWVWVPATIVLIIICYRTGEPPRWRWGKD